MEYAKFSNEQLLELLKRDDKQAFNVLFKLYWKDCFRIAYQKLNSKTLAEEVTQNIFISLWERRNQVEIKNLQAYLRTSVKYQVINFIEAKLSRQKLLVKIAVGEQAANPIEEGVYYQELMDALEKAIQNLPEKTGRIYRLSRYEYLSGKEIAQKMGLSEKSVEYHMTRALKFLRLELKDHLIEPATVALLVAMI